MHQAFAKSTIVTELCGLWSIKYCAIFWEEIDGKVLQPLKIVFIV